MAKRISLKEETLLEKEPETTGEKRAAEILKVIMSYARLDFSAKTAIGNNADVFDAIAAGVNMLGEELKNSSISLKEKEHLLQEIHHRVKNNMQIIFSLLNLQSENETDKKFLVLIRECQNRIKAIALIHEMLYATHGFKYTNFFEYVEKLTKNLVYSCAIPGMKVDFNLEIDKEVCFEVDRIIPLGLIINEIVTNSLKYAFSKSNKGLISIKLDHKPGKFYQLTISDNGIGLPEEFTIKNKSSLGMQLIYLLAEQIGSSVNLDSTNGISYRLKFD